MQGNDTLHARSGLVGDSPLSKENLTFLLHLGVGESVRSADTKPLQKWLVRKATLETRPCIFDKSVKDGESAQLLVHASVFPKFGLELGKSFSDASELTAFSGSLERLLRDQMSVIV